MYMPGGPEVVKEVLVEELQEICKEIPASVLESLYSSMPRRVVVVIKTEGWYTRYQTRGTRNFHTECIIQLIPLATCVNQTMTADLCAAKRKLCALNVRAAQATFARGVVFFATQLYEVFT